MGFDYLDFQFRIEKTFKIEITKDDRKELERMRSSFEELTAGDLWDWIQQMARRQDVQLPRSGWNRMKVVLMDANGVSPAKVRKNLLLKEIGFW